MSAWPRTVKASGWTRRAGRGDGSLEEPGPATENETEIEIETARSNRAAPRCTGPAFALLNVRRIRDSNS